MKKDTIQRKINRADLAWKGMKKILTLLQRANPNIKSDIMAKHNIQEKFGI